MTLRALAQRIPHWHRTLNSVRPASWFVLVFFVLIALPAVIQLLGPGSGNSGTENRSLAPPPSWPQRATDALKVPGLMDAWLADRFGLRGPLVRLNTWLRWHLFQELSSTLLIPGRHGRIFFGSHNGAPPDSLITVVCGAETTDAMLNLAESNIRHTLAVARNAGFQPTLLLVPTAARLYPEDLPPRLSEKCEGGTPPADAVMARLSDENVVYPLGEMLRWKQQIEVIPRHRFHWAGEVPRRVTALLAETRWGLTRDFPITFSRRSRTSDLNQLSPGLGLSDMVDEPQSRQAGVRECWSVKCEIAELPEEARLPLTISARAGEGRLLIIADSFGDDIAPDFSEYFAEVWTVHTNYSRTISPASRKLLATELRQRFQGDRLLLIAHDFAVTGDFDKLVTDVLPME
jgi:hypothetical protein